MILNLACFDFSILNNFSILVENYHNDFGNT